MLPHQQHQLQGQTIAYGRQNGNQPIHHQQPPAYNSGPLPHPIQANVQMQQPMSLTQHPPMQVQDHQLHHHSLQHQPLQQQLQPQLHPQQQQVKHEHQQQQQYRQQQQHDQIREHLELLVQNTQQTAELLRNSCQLQEDLIIKTQDRAKLLSKKNIQEANQDLCGLERTKAELSSHELLIRKHGSELKEMRCAVFAQVKDIFDQMSVIQNTVLYEYLPKWHQDQQLVNNEAKTENHALDQIQIWVELLTDITWRLRNQLKALNYYVRNLGSFNLDELNYMGLAINRSLEHLVLNTFVVEKQPPQVMKTNTRFTSTVRFLSGARLNVQMINPTVKATILSESNARAIKQRHHEIIQTSWQYLENPTTILQGQQAQQQPTGIISPSQTHPTNQNSTYSNQSATNIVASQSPSSHQPQTPQQQQFFQQQHPPQFHVQHPQQSPSMTNQYQQMQPEMAYHPQKLLNINEFDASGEILNSSNILEYQETTRQLVCNFRNMQLKKIKRTEKKGTESVMDEKFILLFHAEFRIAEPYLADNSCSSSTNAISWIKQGDLSFHIMAFSLPVVVIVHGNQDPHAWATVTWHNAFARPDNLLYQVPEKVYWHELGQVLSDKFRAFAGKGLSSQNLEYLATKVTRNRGGDISQLMVTWNQFAKEPLPEKNFTFWEWFHSILKLTKEHLRDLWNADRIYGFVGKQGCVNLLLGSTLYEPTPAGTFLLRYSETELGGITIAWVSSSAQSNQNGHIQMLQRRSPTNSSSNVLMHLQPFVSKDLNTRTLADRIRDLDDLVYLYPDIPKDEAFRSYYSPLNDTAPLTNGYIKPMLVQTLVTNYPKNLTTMMDFAATPATPNSFSQSSPDGTYSDNNWPEADRMG